MHTTASVLFSIHPVDTVSHSFLILQKKKATRSLARSTIWISYASVTALLINSGHHFPFSKRVARSFNIEVFSSSSQGQKHYEMGKLRHSESEWFSTGFRKAGLSVRAGTIYDFCVWVVYNSVVQHHDQDCRNMIIKLLMIHTELIYILLRYNLNKSRSNRSWGCCHLLMASLLEKMHRKKECGNC